MPMTAPGKFDSNGAWDGFRGEIWQEEINVRDFIQKNYTPYDGDEAFLADPTDRTQKLWNHVQKLQKEEREKGGVLECETEVVSGLTAYGAGYISEDMKELEQIVGLQTDKPLKRAFMPYGGIRMAVQAAETYGYEINPELKKIFTTYVTTHNDAVFGAYTPEMRLDHIQEIFPVPAGILHNSFQSILFSYLESPLYINQFLLDDFSSSVANIITMAYPFHRVLSLQFLGNSLRTFHLIFNQLKAFLCLFMQICQIAVHSGGQKKVCINSRFMFFQIFLPKHSPESNRSGFLRIVKIR